MRWIVRTDENELEVFLSIFGYELCVSETDIVVDFLEFGEVGIVHMR